MPRPRVTIFLSTLALLLVLLAETPAAANVIVRKDGNDTKGPLDLAAARVSHAPGASWFKIKARSRFTNKQINGNKGFFEVDIDTNADKAPNYYVVVVSRKGKMRGWLFRGNNKIVTRKLVARRGRRVVRVKVPLAKIGSPKSYDFAAFSSYFAAPCSSGHPCIDSIPNDYPLIRHDLTAPIFTWVTPPPQYSTDTSATRTITVSFSVHDDPYGSGLKSWAFQRRTVGTTTWSTLKTGTRHSPTFGVAGNQGVGYDYRVVVVDKQGNKRVGSVKRTSFPYNDSNTTFFDYTTVGWTDGPTTNQFLGDSTQGSATDEVSFNVVGGHEFCILGGPGSDDAAASVVVGVSPPAIVNETSATPARYKVLCDTPASDDTVTLTVTAGTFVLDGVVIER